MKHNCKTKPYVFEHFTARKVGTCKLKAKYGCVDKIHAHTLVVSDETVTNLTADNINSKNTTTENLTVNGNAIITGSLEVDGPIVPYSKQTITVGVDFPTIQSVFDSFKGKNVGNMTVIIPPGVYNEYITMEGFSSQLPFIEHDFKQGDELISTTLEGLQILGDNRPYGPGKSYANGYENAANSGRNLNYVITTSNPTSGPYNAFLAVNFGAIGGVGPAGFEIANPLLACDPLIGFTPGNVALIERGACAFASKTFNAQLAGASATIMYNDLPTGIVAMSGTNDEITIPAYSISQADGLTLTTLINDNPGIQVTVSPVGSIYSPPFGTNYGTVALVQPTFTADVNGTILNVTSFPPGTAPIALGQVISGAGIVSGTTIVSFGTGTGGIGTYNLDTSQTPATDVAITVLNVVTIEIVSVPLADDNINALPVLEQPKFDAASSNGAITLVPGDQIALSDSDIMFSNFANSLHTITAINGNTIQFTPAADPSQGDVNLAGLGANITFLPNVQISPPNDPNNLSVALFVANGVSFAMNGVWINQNANQPFAKITTGIYLSQSLASLSNVVITDFFDTSANGFAVDTFASTIVLDDAWRDTANSYLAIVGWSSGLGLYASNIGAGNIFITHLFAAGNSLDAASNLWTYNLQLFGSAGLYLANTYGGFAVGDISDNGDPGTANSMTVVKLFELADIVGPGVALYGSYVYASNPSVRIDRCYYIQGGYDNFLGGIFVNTSSKFTIDKGQFYVDGTPATQPTMTSSITSCYDLTPIFGPGFTYPNVGVYVHESAEFVALGNMNFANNDYNFLTIKTGKYSTPYNTVPSGAQNLGLSDSDNTFNDIFQHSSTSQSLNSVFKLQSLAATPVNLDLDPSATYPGIAPINTYNKLYNGKTYTLFTLTNDVHTLTLATGNFLPNTGLGTIATFNGGAGSSLTIRVLSDSVVLILGKNGVSIN